MKYHTEYTAIHSGAHRTPASPLGAPGLCRQLNFWIAPPSDRATDLTFDQRQASWIRFIDYFLRNVFSQIQVHDKRAKDRLTFNFHSRTKSIYLFSHTISNDGSIRPIFESPKRAQAGFTFENDKDLCYADIPARYRTVTFSFRWHGLPAVLKASLHHEYFTLGVFIDLCTRTGSEKPATGPIVQIDEAIYQINEICGLRFRTVHPNWRGNTTRWEAATRMERERLKSANEQIYHSVWKAFDKEFIDPSLSLNGESDFLEDPIGRVVFDSRGLVLFCPELQSDTSDESLRGAQRDDPFGDTPRSLEGVELSGDKELDKDATGPDIFGHTFHQLHRVPLEQTIRPKARFSKREAIHYAEGIWPLITATDPAEDSRIEYSASKFLHDRAIYITSLGAQHIDALTNETPTTFVLLSRLTNRLQIGRLVDRVYLLDSVRVAALFDLRFLTKAGDDLRDLASEVSAFMQKDRPLSEQPGFSSTIDSFRQRTAKLGLECDGGIEYRIERSRYYVSQLRETVKTFRIDRIEGFQQFDEFVQRRFYSTYDYIDRIGQRLNNQKRDLDFIADQVQAEQLLGVSQSNLERQSYLARIQINLLELQIIGEAFLVIPATYYLGHIINEIRDSIIDRGAGWTFYTYAAIFAASVAVAILRTRRHFKTLHRLLARLKNRGKTASP